MKISDEKGSTLVLILILTILFSIVVIGLMTRSSAETRITTSDGAHIAAEFVAQAGAKIAVDEITKKLEERNGNVLENVSYFTKTPTADIEIDSKSGTFSYSYKPNGDSIENLSAITILATGKVGNVTLTKKVDVIVNTSARGLPGPGVASLLTGSGVTYSENKKWGIDNTDEANPVANPPSNSGHYRVLFGDSLEKNFKVSYNATITGTTVANNSGWGIHYFESGTADAPTSYVFQYDPGANMKFDTTTSDPNHGVDDGGAFFVKKVVNGGEKWEESYVQNGQTKYREVNRYCGIPFEESNSTNGTTKVSLKELQQFAKENGINDFEIYNQQHKVSIEVKEETLSDGTKRLRHFVYIDDIAKPVLNFVDNTKLNKIPTPLTDADPTKKFGSGIRVWNSSCMFYNDPGSSYGQSKYNNVYWYQ